jgi:hypothetical protein
MQALKAAQSDIARQALYACSRSERAAFDMDVSDVSITFLHWSALIPERAPQVSAFSQTFPAMSGPPPLQAVAPTASRMAAAAVDGALGIVGSSRMG